MSTFSYSIKTAFVLFPIVALFFTLPYILYQYHKYGSVSSFRSVIIYSFLLYMMTSYFLVILPLPSIEVVSKMKTPAYNLVPFHFVSQILNRTSLQLSDFATYFPTMKQPVVYEAFFNLLLTVPFGVYLHYYFKCDFKHTLFYSFCFSLFFEVTQITGLYYIYPRAYRTFDVDDLLLNTLGGCVGYCVGTLFLKILPTRDEIDEKSLKNGLKVSVLRRILTFGIDIFITLLYFSSAVYLLKEYDLLSKKIFISLLILWLFFYFVILPKVLNGKTIGMKFLKLKFSSPYQKLKWYHYFLHFFLFVFEYFLLPFLLLLIGYYFYTLGKLDQLSWEYYTIVVLSITIMIYVITFLKWLFHSRALYEKLSKMTVESVIKK